MDFFAHTTNWIKGELFESKLILAFGITSAMLGFLFWKIGTTPNAKAMLLPLVIVGGIYSAIGSNMLISNQKRLHGMKQSYEQNESNFIQREKKRVESFQYQYVISKAVATIFFIATVLIFWFTKSPVWQGAGIGLSLFGLAGLIVDHFSQERALIYYQKLIDYISQ